MEHRLGVDVMEVNSEISRSLGGQLLTGGGGEFILERNA